MKALVYEKYAPDDDYKKILKVMDVPEPKPKPNEVVFKVIVAGLNHDDIWGMRGKPIQIPMPHISGTDAAGQVVAVGEDVSTIKVGDRVVSHGNLSCRVCVACTEGREYDCRYRKIWGFQTGPLWGAYCEYAHLPEVNVVKIPENVSYEDAAAASMTMTTSWHMLVGRAKIQPGQTVLIMGGGSGMGTFGIQIAKLHGCDVIATASPNKLEECLKLGADFAVDHRKEDWNKQVFTISKDLAKQKQSSPGIDVIFEHIGGSHWNKELALLKYGATLVTTGATTGYDVISDLRHVFFKGTNILGSTQGTRSELESGIFWMSKGKMKSIVDSIYTFENAVEAHTKMLQGNLFGKILMKPT
ncbi:MAG: zinc-binding dehydrogenase [Thaumarchaeota archaeon]|nr:zinc-binding dehydrogenase [Nitrososphaerota archaeon]MDE1838849.1 zinc-binding dehydrogenase [Nitrososphaerota archaeon]